MCSGPETTSVSEPARTASGSMGLADAARAASAGAADSRGGRRLTRPRPPETPDVDHQANGAARGDEPADAPGLRARKNHRGVIVESHHLVACGGAAQMRRGGLHRGRRDVIDVAKVDVGHLLGIETHLARVGLHEASRIEPGGEVRHVARFERAQDAAADLRRAAEVVERQAFGFARLLKEAAGVYLVHAGSASARLVSPAHRMSHGVLSRLRGGVLVPLRGFLAVFGASTPRTSGDTGR